MRVPAICHSRTLGPAQPKDPWLASQSWGQCSQPSPWDFGWAGRSPAYSCFFLSSSRQWLLLSQGAISTSLIGKKEEDLSSLSVLFFALQGSQGTQRCMTSPKFMEVQRKISYLVCEMLSLRSLKQNPSPEKTPLSSEEKPDLHRSAVFVSSCTVMQTPRFPEGLKMVYFLSFFFLQLSIFLLITLGS